ncbi:MAG: phosphoglycerate mutase family protein [bacterium]
MSALIGLIRALPMAAAIGLAAMSAVDAQTAAAPITAIFVRHAEKAATPADDPPLTAAGEMRARELVDVVRDAHVTAIITTQFARTRGTAQPSAAALGITPEAMPASSPAHVQDVAAAIRTHAGQTVLVVGHSNTVPAIIEALGGTRPLSICDLVYDNLYVVTIPPTGAVGVVHSKYGAASPADVSCLSAK